MVYNEKTNIRLKEVIVKDFKRFTDLQIKDLPQTAKLIVLAGPNGSGKSSFFDALNLWHRFTCRDSGYSTDTDYYQKISSNNFYRINNAVDIKFHNTEPKNTQEDKKIFYFRSAYRNEAEFQATQFNKTSKEPGVYRMIDNNAVVSQNYKLMISQGLESVYEVENPQITIGEFREKTIGEVKNAMLSIFPDLELNSLGNPLKTGTFKFTKGISKGFMFKNLSGGEKAVFDLILDLVIAKREYNHTIFCIDEPESHMNAKIQAKLLFVLFELTPDNCQLIVATHSIGMMRQAKDIERKNPGSVAFLNFGERDFDKSEVIKSEKPSREFWQKAYDVALDDLASLIAPRKVIICEGMPLGTPKCKNVAHDARCYNKIFEDSHPDVHFISGGNSSDVENDKIGLAEALRALVDGLEIVRLIDRDDQSGQEVTDKNRSGIRVLTRRNLESYLFDNNVLRALASSVGKEDKIEELLEEKDKIVVTKKGAPNDLKPHRGEIYNLCKKEFELTECGDSAEAFMRDTLAPLVKECEIFTQLETDIFGK